MKQSIIQRTYLKFKEFALASEKKGDVNSFLSFADNAANIASMINWIYYDSIFEDYFKLVASKIETSSEFIPDPKKIIFYDEIGSVACLTVQYLQALIDLDYEIFYVFQSNQRILSPAILEMVNNYSKCRVLVVNPAIEDKVNQIQSLSNEITRFGAEKAILQTPAEGAFGAVLWNTLGHIKRFRVVPGDHHFYFGVKCTDYFLEFRRFGYTTAIEQRDITSKQIFIQPYYPLVKKDEIFQGFPDHKDNTITIFSAASPYKVYGENDKYFTILKKLLEIKPEVKIIFAGGGFLDPFKKFIRDNNLEERIALVGYRKDIGKCVENCDIYLCTYPMTGGLTSQYAAYFSKPILSFTDPKLPGNKIEDIIAGVTEQEIKITYDSEREFFDYAERLVLDVQFRTERGRYMKQIAFEPSQFAKVLESNLSLTQSFYPQKIDINYKKIIDMNMERENDYLPGFRLYMIMYLLKNKNFTQFLFLFRTLLGSQLVYKSVFNKILKLS